MSAARPSGAGLRFPLWGIFALMTAVALLAAVPHGLYVVVYLVALLVTGAGAGVVLVLIESPCRVLLQCCRQKSDLADAPTVHERAE